MIKLLCVGSMKKKEMKALQDDYLKRLSHYIKIELIETAEANSKLKNPDLIQKEEAIHILNKIKESDFVVLCDLKGTNIDSVTLSKKIEQWSNKDIVFIIGGSWGVSEKVKKRANYKWQLSLLTFPHLLARIMVLEQLYRSYKIINNQEYHK